MQFTPISETALVGNLPPPACLENQRQLWAFSQLLQSQSAFREIVVGMNNITIFVDFCLDFQPIIAELKDLWSQNKVDDFQPRLINIPVVYGGDVGTDLLEVAKFHKRTPEEIIEIHSTPIYTVYMIGFQAGFPYLGGLPETLHTPRHATPRTLVPAGSVGIGGSQTGVYPFASPGGWQLIGHTDLPLFDKTQSPPTLLQAGDNVQFVVKGVEL